MTLPPNCGLRPKDKDTVFAFQVGGGVGYWVDDTTTVQLSYKYQLAPGVQFDGKGVAGTVKTKSDMKIHLFESASAIISDRAAGPGRPLARRPVARSRMPAADPDFLPAIGLDLQTEPLKRQ